MSFRPIEKNSLQNPVSPVKYNDNFIGAYLGVVYERNRPTRIISSDTGI
jgi:hypothetical protein